MRMPVLQVGLQPNAFRPDWDFDDPVLSQQFKGHDKFDPTRRLYHAIIKKHGDDPVSYDSKRELCRKCGRYGQQTGVIESMPQADNDGNPITDGDGNTLYMDFPELMCENSHRWYLGEGKHRGINGKNPILFENHLQDRRRREIYTSIGTPDPSIQRGMYNRTHPQGRKVNSKEQRKRNGASFFR
jgi:hypothetical protein